MEGTEEVNSMREIKGMINDVRNERRTRQRRIKEIHRL